MEEDKKGESRKTTNPIRQHPRPSRRTQGHRSSRLSIEENSSQPGDTEDIPSFFGVRLQNMHENGPNTVSEDSTNSIAPDLSLSADYLNRSGLNGVRQLLDDVDEQIPCVDAATLNPTEVQNNIGVNHSRRTRNNSPSSHRAERRHPRRRVQHQNPGSLRAETFVRNTSPSRQGRHHGTGQHVPPLRFSAAATSESPPPTSPMIDFTSSSRFADDLFGPTRQLGPFPNPYVRGYGTQDEPYELSPGLSDDSSPPAFDSPSSLQSDEEIARQLQQEEWEVASSHGGGRHHPRQSRAGAINTYHYLHRRGRDSEVSPLRLSRSLGNGRSGPGSSRESNSHQGGGSGPQASGNPSVFLPPGFRYQSLDEPLPTRIRLAHLANPPDDLEGSYGNLAFLTDLLGSYGIADWSEMEPFLNPGVVGQRHLVNPDTMEYEALLALEEQLGVVSRGMNDHEIDRLAICRHRTSPSRQEAVAAAAAASFDSALPECNICLSEYENGDEKRVMPCKHEFHKQCIDQWLKANATCPVCRSDARKKNS